MPWYILLQLLMCLQIWFCHMRHSSEMTLRITTNYYSSYVPLWLSLIYLFIYGTQLGLPMRRCKKRRHFNNSCAMLLCWHLSHHYHASCLFECCCWMLMLPSLNQFKKMPHMWNWEMILLTKYLHYTT